MALQESTALALLNAAAVQQGYSGWPALLRTLALPFLASWLQFGGTVTEIASVAALVALPRDAVSTALDLTGQPGDAASGRPLPRPVQRGTDAADGGQSAVAADAADGATAIDNDAARFGLAGALQALRGGAMHALVATGHVLHCGQVQCSQQVSTAQSAQDAHALQAAGREVRVHFIAA